MNTFLTTILALAGFCTALITILAFLEKINLGFRHWFLNPIKESIEDINIRLNELSDNVLKLTICNDNIPITERLIAGNIYVKRGLNGEIKVKYKLLKEEYEQYLKDKEE